MVARSNRARHTTKDVHNQVVTNYRRAFFMSFCSTSVTVLHVRSISYQIFPISFHEVSFKTTVDEDGKISVNLILAF